MSLLENFRNLSTEAIETIRENPLLNAAAKTALRRIPVVGDLLVDIYESSRSSDDKKMARLVQVLSRFEQFTQAEFEGLEKRLSAILESSKLNGRALEMLLDTSATIIEKLGGIGLELDRNHTALLKLRDELSRQAERFNRFDVELLGDRLFFYVHLQRLLAPTKAIFKTQLRLADLILAGVEGAPSGKGLDDDVRLFHDRIPSDRRPALRALRRHTDDMREMHLRIWRLLADNRSFFTDLPDLALLHDHLSTWLAKYEFLRFDPHMCLVFAGAAQGKPFPNSIEDKIGERIENLRATARIESPL